MKSVLDKEAVMKSLEKLKDASNHLRKISITKDYTQEEWKSWQQKKIVSKQMTETRGKENLCGGSEGLQKMGWYYEGLM